MPCLPFVRHSSSFQDIVTRTHTHTHTRARTHSLTHTHTHTHTYTRTHAHTPVRKEKKNIYITNTEKESPTIATLEAAFGGDRRRRRRRPIPTTTTTGRDGVHWLTSLALSSASFRTVHRIMPAGTVSKPSSPTAVFPASDRRRQRSTLG